MVGGPSEHSDYSRPSAARTALRPAPRATRARCRGGGQGHPSGQEDPAGTRDSRTSAAWSAPGWCCNTSRQTVSGTMTSEKSPRRSVAVNSCRWIRGPASHTTRGSALLVPTQAPFDVLANEALHQLGSMRIQQTPHCFEHEVVEVLEPARADECFHLAVEASGMSVLIVTVRALDTLQPSQVNDTTVSDVLRLVFTREGAQVPNGRTKCAATRSRVVRIARRAWVRPRCSP